MRKRVLEVEQKIAAGNRENLLGTTPTSEKREKVSSAEAGTRLRSVNNMIGGIINQGQVNTILLRFTSTEGVAITPEKITREFFSNSAKGHFCGNDFYNTKYAELARE